MSFSTGQLAEIFGVTNEGIRYLEKQGIIRSERSANGYRVFNYDQQVRLRRYKTLKLLGFDISEIKSMLDDDFSLQECRAKYRDNLERIRLQRRLLDEAENDIVNKLNTIETFQAGAQAWNVCTPEPFWFFLRKKNGVPVKGANFDPFSEKSMKDHAPDIRMLAIYCSSGDELKGSMVPEKYFGGGELPNDADTFRYDLGRCVHGALTSIKFEWPDSESIFRQIRRMGHTPEGTLFCFMQLSYHEMEQSGCLLQEFLAPVK